MKLLMILAAATVTAAVAAPATPETRDYPIAPVPFTAVRIEGGFWGPRFETNRETTIGYDFAKCEETGRIDNFAKAGGLMPGEFRGIPFDDSDVYKVVEGASYSLAVHPDPKLDAYLDALIAKFAAAQEPDGYLYTARRLFTPEKMPGMSGPQRWSHLAASHELYNVGHLYEAAAAHFLATGKRSLLDVAVKNADLLVKTFGFGPGQLQEPPGHQEIEIGLAKLYRVTGQRKYLDLAQAFLDMRGKPGNGRKLRGPYQQDHQPVLEQTEAVGHAVRATYMYSGMADVAALTGDRRYVDAIDRLWDNVAGRKLYLTGAIGARPGGEAYGDDYELPNASSYNETCANLANGLWNHRMFLLHGDAKYIDVLERVIYNGFLSGIAMTGDRFFYPNPLESDGRTKFNHGSTTRQPWFGCSCCPVNVVRFIPSIAGYVYATKDDTIYANLYAAGTGTVKLGDREVRLTQETQYPWDGTVKLTVAPAQAGKFTLALRIPGWAQGRPVPTDLYRYADAKAEPVVVKINGRAQTVQGMDKGFLPLSRAWTPGDTVELVFPMPVRRVLAHDAVKADAGRAAVERGPVVYCAEGADHAGRVLNLALPLEAALTPEARPDLLNDVTVLKGRGLAATRDANGAVAAQPADVTLIPYYAWCHRGANEMAVWFPLDPKDARVPPPPTLAASATTSASFRHEQDAVEALSDGIEPKNSIDHSIPRFTWWDHRGTAEWVQYDFAKAEKVRAVEVYWFDDTGRGQCRVPASWKLLYRDGGAWKPVAAKSEFGIAKDRFNIVDFEPVETKALRLEVQLGEKVSGGILEWKVR